MTWICLKPFFCEENDNIYIYIYILLGSKCLRLNI